MSRTRTPGAPWRGLLRWGLTLGLLAWVLTRVELSTVLGELRLAPLWIWAVVPLLFVVNSLLYCLRVLALTAEPAPPLGAVERGGSARAGRCYGECSPCGGILRPLAQGAT